MNNLRYNWKVTFFLFLESTVELMQLKNKSKQAEYQNRQTRAQSVQDVKEKLQAANAQIVTLLKDKIALNDKIAKMKQLNNWTKI